MEVNTMNKIFYCFLLFLRMVCYCYLFPVLFSVFFPYTGLGWIYYLRMTILIWGLFGLGLSIILFYIHYFYKFRIQFEFLYICFFLIYLLCTFVQEFNEVPIKLLISKKFPTLEDIKVGIEWLKSRLWSL